MIHIRQNKNYVVHRKNGWGYKKAKSDRLSRRASTQQKAFDLARKNAIKNKSSVIMQGLNNKFRQGDNYNKYHY